MRRLLSTIADLYRNKSGNFAIIAGAVSVPLALAVGLSVDYSRYQSSHAHLQELNDIAALALASSKEQNKKKLTELAELTIDRNRDPSRLDQVEIESLEATSDEIDLRLKGDIPATFMGIAGYDRLPSRTSTLAERAIRGNVEVALVLDNTWSMSEADPKGITKIGALKTAAGNLVKELLSDADGAVRIGLVPYADYVNVGTKYRNAPWLDVGDDYVTDPKPKTCTTKTTKTVCDKQKPTTTCERVVDGVKETYNCGGGCEAGYSREVTVAPYESCSGGGNGTAYKWYGCVGSRMPSDYRLHDKFPTSRYPGYLETGIKCLNPLTTLTSNKADLLSAVDGMIINRGTSYRPNTYIPAGLVWGLNVLSPTEPFADSDDYDPANLKPRKVAVLMTDGENTLRFNTANGRHVAFNGSAANQLNQFKQVNADTLSICTYMKAQNIEIYSVAFMVDDADAKALMQGCATDSAHYFDASDSDSLLAAFSGISSSLRVVRLAR
ncbi:MAG: VWA domain-containing protein [Rhizobiaceae bacterium]|nr:VWA domain-containing protein [Rhizobiaceae bacterium]